LIFKKVTAKYVEFGIGNGNFISTEWEYTDGTEERFQEFRKIKVNDIYIRIWLGKKMYILSSRDGFKSKLKNSKSFKLLLGISGT
jgi:hypothetical protein